MCLMPMPSMFTTQFHSIIYLSFIWPSFKFIRTSTTNPWREKASELESGTVGKSGAAGVRVRARGNRVKEKKRDREKESGAESVCV